MKKLTIFGIVLVFLVSLAVATTVTTTGYFGNFVQDKWNTSNSVKILLLLEEILTLFILIFLNMQT